MNQLAPINVVERDIFALQDRFEQLNVHRTVVFQQEQEFAMQLMNSNKTLLDVAVKNRQSLADAILNVANIGLSLNPAKKEAYLLPRKAAGGGGMMVCLDISYRGLTNLATTSKSILWAQAKLVHRGDKFVVRQFGESPIHEFDAFAPRGEWVGVYCVAKTVDGSFLVDFMSRDEVYAIRDRSEAWKAYVAKKIYSCPWVTDEGEMAKKTIIKRASKTWPVTPRLDSAVHYLNTTTGEGLADIHQGEASPTAGQTPISERDQLLAEIESSTTPEQFKAAKQKAQSYASQRKDAKLYEEVTAFAKAHAQKLKQQAQVSDVEPRMATA